MSSGTIVIGRRPEAALGEFEGGAGSISTSTAWYAGLAATFAVGATLLRYSYAEAFAHALTGGDLTYHYGLYWLGMAAFLVPVTIRLLRPQARDGERRVLLIAVAMFTYIPSVLRSHGSPLFFDELAHWSQSEHLYQSGKLFQPNVVSVISDYPGLHILTVAIRFLSGLSTYQTGLVIGALGHVLELLAVFVLARRLLGSDRVAALAGLCYAVNPGYTLFTAQYAYETLALIFVAWAIALMQEAGADESGRGVRWRLTVLTGIVVAACAVTHHLSALLLTVLLLVYALAYRPWRNWERGGHAVAVALFCLAVNAIWIGLFGSQVLTYLAPYPRQGLAQVLSLFTGGGQGGSGRSAFQASSLPGYETLLALAAPPLVSSLGAAGAWLNRRRLRTSPMLRTVLVTAVCYPLSIPFVLTTTGAPGAHRSWPFTYLALSVLAAVSIVALYSRLSGKRTAARTALRRMNALALSVCVLLVLALLVGNSGSENNDESMFPGPWRSGTDARTESAELVALAAWAKQTQGGGHNFISDYVTAGVFGAFADDRFLVNFPSWDLYFYDATPKTQTIELLGPDRVAYMLVDDRLSQAPFNAGYYFDQSEPQAFTRVTPISPAALRKFLGYPWAVKIYQSQHYALYRLEPAQLNAQVYGGSS